MSDEKKDETEKPKQRDKWDRAQIIGQLLLPVVIAGVGFSIGWQDKKHQEENHKIERVTDLLDLLASDNEKANLVAISMIGYLNEKQQVDPGLVSSIRGVCDEVKSKNLLKACAEVLGQIAKNETSTNETKEAANVANVALKTLSNSKRPDVSIAAKQAIAKTDSSSTTEIEKLPARVYLQVQKDTNRELATNLQAKLKANNLIAPGIEGVDKATEVTEIRYFESEFSTADLEQIKKVLEALKITNFKVVDISKDYPDSKVRPRHYEIWLGKDTIKN